MSTTGNHILSNIILCFVSIISLIVCSVSMIQKKMKKEKLDTVIWLWFVLSLLGSVLFPSIVYIEFQTA